MLLQFEDLIFAGLSFISYLILYFARYLMLARSQSPCSQRKAGQIPLPQKSMPIHRYFINQWQVCQPI